MRIININNNNNIDQRFTFKSYLELFGNILILVPLLIYFLYLKQKSSTINSHKTKYKLDKSNSNNENNTFKFRSLDLIYQGHYSKEEMKKKLQYKHIIDKLIPKKYYGKWFSDSSENKTLIIGNSLTGLTLVKFNKALEKFTKDEALAITITNYENDTINHWWHYSSYIISKFIEFIPDQENNLFIMKGKWDTELEYGELFETKITRRFPCSSNISLEFPLKRVNYLINNDEDNYTMAFDSLEDFMFKINISSYCGFNMSMELYPEGENNLFYNKKKEKKEVLKYFAVIMIIILINILSNVIIYHEIKENNNDAINCIPLFSLGFNINWHIYCCITHISWSFKYSEYYYEFNSIGLLYIINIIFYDFKFSCLFWNIVQHRTSNRIYVQKRMIYYISFYLFFFISFFIIPDLLIYYESITLIGLLTWTPQIIYNIIYNNKYTYPIIYIITSSLDKLFFGIYFRGYDSNYLRIKGNKHFISVLICYILSNLIILYLQYNIKPRFFLGKRCQKKEFDFYKTKNELIKTIKDVEKMECVICLMPIFSEENQEIFINNTNIDEMNNNKINIENNIENKNVNVSISELKIDNELNLGNKNIKLKHNKNNKINCKFSINSFEYLFKFKKKSQNANKDYMSTPCHHVFHKECLEKWLLLKKECPNCRYSLSDVIL